MGDFIRLFTCFGGRINRAWWWLGFVTVEILSLAAALVFNPDFFSLDPNVVAQPVWAETIWDLLLIIPYTAIMVKRFNDRDWPNWLGYAVGLLGALTVLAPHVGLFTFGPDMSAAEGVGFMVALVVFLFAVIDNGFLRGTKGPNRYGPDPLQDKQELTDAERA